jgi:hypothetical protein
MSEGGPADHEYALRLAMTDLRRQVYGSPGADRSEELLAALEERERQLSELDDQKLQDDVRDPAARILHYVPAARSGGRETRSPQVTGLAAEAWLRMSAVPTSIYHILDPKHEPLVTGTVKNLSEQQRRIRVTSYLEGYSASAVDTFDLPKGKETSFDQLPTLFPDRLRNLHELTAATVNVLIEDLDGAAELHRTMRVPLLARTTVPWLVRDPATKAVKDLSRYFGAFVTPNAPAVQQFLRDAVDSRRGAASLGSHRSPEDVTSDVEAVFRALRALDIRYINSVLAVNPEDGLATQRVRLPRESLANRSANCIDGTVLMASLLEGCSVSAALVFVPGHAFLAWETKVGTENWHYLETTLVGGSASFAQACSEGEEQARRYQRLKAETSNEFKFRLRALRDLRTEGITPME